MPLTDLQKAQNKAAASVRKRAHTARRRELSAALVAMEVQTIAFRAMKEKEVAERFSDLSGRARWSSAVWTPPQDVQDAMEQARRTAVVVPKEPKGAKK